MVQKLKPARVFPPGRVISEELEARNWSQRDLAEIMGRPPQTINEIVKGTKQITPETALELSDAFGVSAEFWTNLETNYQLFLARQRTQEKSIARKSKIYEMAPIAEMTKLGWLEKTKLVHELEQQVCQFFEVSSIDESPKLALNFRYSQHREPKLNAQLAWAKRVENLSRQQIVEAYDRQKLIESIPQLVAMSVIPSNVALVPNYLMSLGLRCVIVPHLSKTYLDGAAFYLDGDEHQPIVAMTLRYNRIDNFWFTLMHEIAHIVLQHEGVILDSFEDDENLDEREQEANEMARDLLIEPDAYNCFIKEAEGRISDQRVKTFSEKNMIHPGILVGRLRRDKQVSYTRFGSHMVQIKNDLQDWNDVAYPRSSINHRKSNFDRLQEIGLIGCCAVEEDLSVNYKSVLADSLEDKYDYR